MLAFAGFVQALFGQAGQAGITGAVVDSTGASIPNARVLIVNVDTNVARDISTDEAGRFLFPVLPIGNYRVEISKEGFKKFSRTGLVLELGQTARVDATLEIGNLAESVEVTAATPQVNTTDAAIGRTVQNKEIITLPLVNRNVYTLLSLTAGVDDNQSTNNFGYPEQRASINGSAYGSSGSVSYYLDGGSNMTQLRNTGGAAPNPDAVQEFRVTTNSYSAEFGRFSAGVIDVITKSGTNQFHGSLFEFLRNDVLNSKDWNVLTKPPLRRNQYGGTFGGPIKRDKTFFFSSFSGLNQRQQDVTIAVVPNEAQRNGNLSSFPAQIRDPLNNNAPFLGNIIPPNRLDPTAQNILKQVPLPNLPNNQAQSTQPRSNDTYEGLIKVDHTFSTKHTLAGSYFLNKGSILEPYSGGGNVPWASRLFDFSQQNVNSTDTYTISPTLINQARFTFIRNTGGRLASPTKTLADFGSKWTVQGDPALPQITVNGFFTLSNAINGPDAGGNYYGFRDTMSWTKGKHAIRFGAEISYDDILQTTNLNNYGTFSFNGNRSGNALADYLLGLPVQFNQDAPVAKTDKGWYYGFFVQDDYRIHPRLVLNLGLRYDLQMPYTDPQDRKLAFSPFTKSTVVPTAPAGLLFPGDPGIPRGIANTDKNNFAPRIGLAWDPTGSGKTSIRAAAGIFYSSVSVNVWNNTADRQPFSARQTFNNVKSLTDPYGNYPNGSPYPYTYDKANPKFLTPAAIYAISRDFVWPVSYQFNASIQREIVRDTTVTFAYVGAMGRHFPFFQDANYPVFTANATTANVDARRPYLTGTFQSIGVLRSIVNTNYHSMQVSFDKRYAKNFVIKGYYTFSKALEGLQLQNESADPGVQNQMNLGLDRARSANDRRHNFVISGIWELKYANNLAAVPRAILSGWTISGVGAFRSGQPFTVTTGRDVNLDGVNNDRPNLVGNPFLSTDRSRTESTNAWFNVSAFQVGANGTDGTAGRNIIEGPGIKQVDFGLFRFFKIREGMQLEARAEMTNAFNFVNLNNPTATLNSPLVGTIRSARQMRQTQIGLRLVF
jgi:hypothetical protein